MDLSDCDFHLSVELIVAIQLLIAARNNAVQTIMRNTWDLIRRRRSLLRKKQELRRKQHRYCCQRLFPNFMNTVVANFAIKHSIRKFRTIRWWEMARNSLSDNEWMENFRMSRATYLSVVQDLSESSLAVVHVQRGALDIGTKCAVAIFKLANFNNYTSVGNLFGIHSSTVFFCISRFCKAVNEVLLPQYLRMPNVEEALEISNRFEEICGLPQVVGAINQTHIPVNVQRKRRQFLNLNNWPSFILQAVVDSNYIFRDVSCNSPGTIDAVTVFSESELYKNIQHLLPSSPKIVGTTEMDFYLVGHTGFPLLPWLITPYLDTEDTARETFNLYINTILEVGETAFDRLKGRFRCLSKKSEFSYSSLPSIISTCVVLHNIVELSGNTFSPLWLDDVNEGKTNYPPPCATTDHSLESEEGVFNRHFLSQYMANNFEVVVAEVT